ncbi:transcriptional regulator [Sphingomonas sp.]|uniref:winged helix-turn-helix domain-containing protein n=1 Tax=Sphingomonas sp. TaxID=28214 RepID=UPI002C1C14B6|nr:transcriptional regulator [Sphingomonas sp.]HWK36375.1 transcriptional regulator [Sphingomonas sp.]
MAAGSLRFDRFVLDVEDRRLMDEAGPVALNARYLDALVLLVREQGRLVTKDRFLDEVWHGVPVTDEALTQCIRALRRALGDDAAHPRLIETVPKHGYRFIAPVGEAVAPPLPSTPPAASRRWRDVLRLTAAGTGGGAVAGIAGGLFYGFAAAAQPSQAGVGTLSILLVVACLTLVIATIGAAGVAFGIAVADALPGRRWLRRVVGGALGGLAVGAVVKLLGTDAFNLVLGQSPGDITGAAEGVVLGGAVGLGAWLAERRAPRHGVALAALSGGVAGAAIPLLGGRLMGGSLDLISHGFAGSRLRLDAIGALFREPGFGLASQAATGALEGALFAGCVVGAMMLAHGGDWRRNSSS